MLTELQFDGKIVRYEDDDRPMFVVKDVCDVLGISDYRGFTQRLSQRLHPDELGFLSIQTDNRGGTQQMRAVTESGLYKIIMKSYGPVAERFCDWLAREVLPTIRKTAVYVHEERARKLSGEKSELMSQITKLASQLLNSRSAEGRYFDLGVRKLEAADARVWADHATVETLEEDVERRRGVFTFDVISDDEVADAYRISKEDANSALKRALPSHNFLGVDGNNRRVWFVRYGEILRSRGYLAAEYRGAGCWRVF